MSNDEHTGGPKPTWQTREPELIPPTPPYRDQPEYSLRVARAIGHAVKACYRKKRYTERGEAVMAATGLRRNFGSDHEVYACGQCGAYHVGSQAKKAEGDEEWRQHE